MIGAAWLSSARALRRSVNSGNERNPNRCFHAARFKANLNKLGPRQVSMALMDWATHVLQWLSYKREATVYT